MLAKLTSRVHLPNAWLAYHAKGCAGDLLEVLEYRHDWANFNFTLEMLKYVVFKMLPEVLVHSKSQDEEQVRDHCAWGDSKRDATDITHR